MLHLYYRPSGARGFQLVQRLATYEEWSVLRQNVLRLLSARGEERAARILELYPFEIWQGTNSFADAFQMLYFAAQPDEYVAVEEGARLPKVGSGDFSDIARTMDELGPHHIRHIVVGVQLDASPAPVPPPQLRVTSDVVERALADAEHLLRSRGAVSAVDRAHTAFHGYLRQVCTDSGLTVEADASVVKLYKRLRVHHPKLTSSNAEVARVMTGLSTIVDSLNTLRNRQSMAHPSETLLHEPEAMLVINAVRTLLHYVDGKIGVE